MVKAVIRSVGSYVPEDVLTNEDLEKLVETSDEWIQTRTGIKERRILKDPAKGTSYIAIEAGRKIIEKATIDPLDVDCVILTTSTPDYGLSSTASFVASQLGCTNAFGFDLGAACSGFLYGLSVGRAYIESGNYKNVLIIGADKMSSIIDYTDRTTCIIFGDGGGGVLLQASNKLEYGIQGEILRSDGMGRELLKVEGGGSVNPASEETIKNKLHYVKQDGKSVYKFAVTNMAEVAHELMEQQGLDENSLEYLLPHQANKRIIDATKERLLLKDEKVLTNIHKFGNTTNGTLPLLFDEFENKFKPGDDLLLAAFGGGFTWGAMHIVWGY